MPKPYSLTLRPSTGHLGAVSLDLRDDLSAQEWEAVGHQLGAISRGHQWWIGDWMRFGERKYGETYTRAAEITGLEYQTLANYAWVATQFEFSRRRENLSFTHHAEIASLSPDEQDRLLDQAEREGWSTRALRAAIQARTARQLPPEILELNRQVAATVQRVIDITGASQRQLAEEVFGTPTQQGTVSRLIAGVHRPNLATVQRLAAVGNIPVTDFGLPDVDVLPAEAVRRAASEALEALERGEIEAAREVLRRLVGEE